MNPLLSVIVPVCNSELYLRECLESVLGQSYEKLEIICVNDGSKDHSLDILNQFKEKDPRVVVVSQPNSGYGKAMNVGIDVAKGKWIGFVESDDYILPNMYENLILAAESNNLDFVKSSPCRFYGEGADRFFQTTPITKRKELLGVVLDPSADPSLLDAVMNNVTGVYKKDFIKNNNIVFNESPGASYQDNGFWFQAFVHGKRIMFVDDSYYMIRRDNPNSSIKSKGKVFCMRDEYLYILNILKRKKIVFDLFIYQWCKKLFSNYIGTLNRIDPVFRLDLLRTMSSDYKVFQQNGWIDFRLYNPKERWTLLEIIDDPEEYAAKYLDYRLNSVNASICANDKKIIAEKKRLERLESSLSLKLGRFLSLSRGA